MTDLTAIAAARTAAQAVEANARALAEQLAAARADIRRLHRELVVLPRRAAGLATALDAAQARANAAAATRAQAGIELSDAQAAVSNADAQVASLEQRLASAQQELQDLLDLLNEPIDNRIAPRLPVDGDGGGGGGGRPNPVLLRRIQQKRTEIESLEGSLSAAQAADAAARQRLANAVAQVAAADGAVSAAQADVSAVATQLAQVRAALDADNAALPAAEARPDGLRTQIAASRQVVHAAWQPWAAMMAAAQADVVAAARRRDAATRRVVKAGVAVTDAGAAVVAAQRAGDAVAITAAEAALAAARAALGTARTGQDKAAAAVDAARAGMLAGDDAESFVALTAADVPLVLLPVRLETRFDPVDGGAADLLVRIFPDTIHVSSHEPELTDDEVVWGRHFIEQEHAAAGDTAARQRAWSQLAGRFGPQRAAWITRSLSSHGDGDPPRRASAWTRPPVSSVLPDRWIAVGYRGGERRVVGLSRPVADTLAVGPEPGAEIPEGGPAPLGEAARWLTDFDRALEVGMALRIRLGPDDAAGFDRLLVFGVHPTLDAVTAAARLAAVLDAHHYTDGLSLLSAGTPTNNTAAARSGWSSSDEGYARSWRAERHGAMSRAGDGSDADRLTKALGVHGQPFVHTDRGDITGEIDARHMATALWPATWGYALTDAFGGVTDAGLAEVRDHVVGRVRSAGPLASILVGRQPYGVLPATSLARWSPLSPSNLEADVPPLLRALVPVWRQAADGIPRVTPGAAIGDVLSTALTMSPVSLRFASRTAVLPTDADSPDRFAGRQAALALPRALDLDVDPRLAGAGFAAGAIELTGPVVSDAPSETDTLPAAGNYVHWLSTVGWQAVRDDPPPAGGDTLLFALLRHSLLRTYATTAADLAAAQGAEPNESVWAALEAPLVGVTGARPLGQFLDDLRASGDFAASPTAASVAELGEVQAALVHLAGLPSAALQRLLAGTLDVCSHRLDAWVTAHATSALDELRRQRSTGLQLGGYGVLHDVRPSPVRALGEQIAQLRATLAAAQARAAAAAPASAQVATELAAAQAQAAASEGDLAALEAQINRTEQQLQSLLDALGEDNRLVGLVQRLPIDGDGGGGGRPDPALQRRIHETEQRLSALRAALPPAQTKAAADGRNAAAVAVRMAAADSELRTAEAEVARLTSQLGEAEAAERDARDVAANKGYIHAPSLGQAATAAVLRSGHLAHKRDADSPFEIDLSSRRVRLALKLLDGIRQGQPLGALLGYRFERGLHEGHPGLALDQYIATLRALAPLDDSTEAEAQLRAALSGEADLAARLGGLELQLGAHRDADQAAKDALRQALAGAQADLDAAQASAAALANQLQLAQDALQLLLDSIDEFDLPSHIPPWKLHDGDISDAGIPAAVLARIHAKQVQVQSLTVALDAATTAATAAAAHVGDLSAQLGVADPQIAILEQAVTDLQPELAAATAAVAAARARLEALRGQILRGVTEAVVANNVVDGLALRRRWRVGVRDARWDTSTIPFGDTQLGLPRLGSPEQQAIDAELAAVDDAVDAVSDLLTAESVHQLVQGNAARAGATVDALSRGEAPPPEPDVVRTERSGVGVTHRLLVVLDPDGPPADGWPTDATQVRALADPALEAWVARLLGPAARVRVRVSYGTVPASGGGTPAGPVAVEVGLDVLGLSALDVCAATVAAAPGGATEIELRLLDHLRHNRPDGVADGAPVTLDASRDPAWGADVLGLGELLEVARQVRELLLGGRPLDGRDLALPGAAADDMVDGTDLARRAALVVRALEDTRTALDAAAASSAPGALREALLRAAAFGVAAAVPLEGSLVAQSVAVRKELDRRAAAVTDGAGDTARLIGALGPEWPVLGRVTLPDATELRAALAAGPDLTGDDPLATSTWLTRAAYVRDGAGRLDRALLYAEALESPEPRDLQVAQLPHRAGDRWVALPATPDHPIEGGRLSLVIQASGQTLDAGRAVCGIVVDEWTEVVPAATQVTGVAFHFDQPNSRPPQAILLAVPPAEEGVWSLDALEAVVGETIDLAQLRLADPEALARSGGAALVPGTGQYLPAIYLASSPADSAVTTDLTRVTAPAPV